MFNWDSDVGVDVVYDPESDDGVKVLYDHDTIELGNRVKYCLDYERVNGPIFSLIRDRVWPHR